MKSTPLALAVVVLSLQSCERDSGEIDDQALKGGTTISREFATPSGDWAGQADYTYGRDGVLRHAIYRFTTFNGFDEATEKFAPTKCVRHYSTSEDGALVLNSKATTDLSSGESVERTFYEPEISHWMTLAQAREEIQAEQVAGGQAR